MKSSSISTILITFLLLSFTSCLNENAIEPIDMGTMVKELETNSMNNAADPMMVIYLEMEKDKTKIEVNRNQAMLNFDNHVPRITRIYSKEKMLNLKHFRAENNLLSEVPELALNLDIKRIEVAHNRIKRLPPINKKYQAIKVLDLSYNKMKVTHSELVKMVLPVGAELNLTATGIPCKYICDYMKRYPDIKVISDCNCKKKVVDPLPIKEMK